MNYVQQLIIVNKQNLFQELGSTEKEVVEYFIKNKIKGYPYSGVSCPVANFLKNKTNKECHVLNNLFYFEDDEGCFSLPFHMIDFIKHFDQGYYPELDIS